ncbi:MAG: D-alanine--D-alanine ligase [Cellvibrionaceae bacterium]|nr:D-alanine--D-alanine ligase [Cellvibrionaceae bacterium]
MTAHDFSTLGRVGVLYGGLSAEREVSLESGGAVFAACERLGVDAVAIDLGEQAIQQLHSANIDTAFIALHGGVGEDGRLQALLDFMSIAYTGSDTQSSVMAMNKLVAKQLWQAYGLLTPAFQVLTDTTNFSEVIDSLGGAVMVKPAHEGSSIGMSIASTAQELRQAYQQALVYDRCVFAERLLTGAEEYTVALVDGEILPPLKLETTHRFYDYDAKYIANDTRYLCPCGLSPSAEDALKTLAVAAFSSLHCSGLGRVDIMRDACGNFQLLEVNTVPGMTCHSLLPMAAEHAGYSFDALVAKILFSVNR